MAGGFERKISYLSRLEKTQQKTGITAISVSVDDFLSECMSALFFV
jgi:hypothetical protein